MSFKLIFIFRIGTQVSSHQPKTNLSSQHQNTRRRGHRPIIQHQTVAELLLGLGMNRRKEVQSTWTRQTMNKFRWRFFRASRRHPQTHRSMILKIVSGHQFRLQNKTILNLPRHFHPEMQTHLKNFLNHYRRTKSTQFSNLPRQHPAKSKKTVQRWATTTIT